MNSQYEPIRVIVTGSTGMVGEGVLYECLRHPDVEQVLVINRKSCGVSHPKLKEIVHRNFFELSLLEGELMNYNACFFCLGVSSVGMKEEEYARLTYDLTLYVAGMLAKWNPGMVFCYISGTGTDSTERGGTMWARVKGRTENDLLKLPFKKAYMFRPGYLHPTMGLHNTHKYYYAITWLYPVLRRLFPNQIMSLSELGVAMIRAVLEGNERSILEVRHIAELARR